MIHVRSEIAPLKKVLLHRPGAELENLAPEFLERLLFDDIPFLQRAQEEHDAFAKILQDNGVEVVYLSETIAEVMKDKAIREAFTEQFMDEAGIKKKTDRSAVKELLDGIADEEAFIRKTMAGINRNELPAREETGLSYYIKDEYPFIADPMPNLYFTRDPFASIGNMVSLNRMYYTTRIRETIYSEYIFKYHPEFKETKLAYDRFFDYTLEGGDILVINEKTLAVGISQRTQSEGVEKLAHRLFHEMEDNSFETVLAFDIPKIRAYMHLDTVFTQIDYDKFTVHPQIMETLVVYELTKGENGTINVVKEEASLESILEKHVGRPVTLIPCGGGDYVTGQREQWNDGANTLAIAPGEVVVYFRNNVTNALLEEAGVKLHIMPCSELSRGRGGPRCMSMPLVRG